MKFLRPAPLFLLCHAMCLSVPALCRAQSDEAKAFFASGFIVDGTCFPYFLPGTTFHRFFRNDEGKFDMAEFRRETGVGTAVWDIRERSEMMKMIGGVEAGHFINTRIIRRFSDLETAHRGGEQGWLFYTQHPWPLNGSIEPIEGWHRDGLRMLQVVYGSTIPVTPGDELGTGSSGGDDNSSGLTDLGKAVVAECNRLGIIVDVSHCNRATTLDVAEFSKAPITSTHAGCDEITVDKRNKSDAEMKAIAKTGGIVGITPIKFMLSDAPKGATMDDFIRHLEHAISVAGIDHVGIAADIKRNGVPEDEIPAYTCPELNGEKRWLHLYDALKKKRYSDENLAKIFGLNYLRVFRAILEP